MSKPAFIFIEIYISLSYKDLTSKLSAWITYLACYGISNIGWRLATPSAAIDTNHRRGATSFAPLSNNNIYMYNQGTIN